MAQLLGVYDGCGAGFPAASAQPLYRGGRGPPAVPLRQPGVDATAVTGPAAVAALLPTQPTRVPSMVGIPTSLRCAPAVEGVRWLGCSLRGWVDARGRDRAAALLHRTAERPLLRGIRGELLAAVGSFAETAGYRYMANDDYAHDYARQMYRFALAYAEETGD